MKDNIVSVRLENKDYDLLQELARVQGISVSDVIRYAIRTNLYTTCAPHLPTTSNDSIVHINFETALV
jgi:hypothetical protein